MTFKQMLLESNKFFKLGILKASQPFAFKHLVPVDVRKDIFMQIYVCWVQDTIHDFHHTGYIQFVAPILCAVIWESFSA